MNLLCYHLCRLGYDAFIVERPRKSDAPLPVRYLSPSIIKQQKRQGREPIVVYPEITAGNPRGARFVVRYLLNKPGFLEPGAELSFGNDDYFLDGAREHAPAGVRSFDLFMPLVDRTVYFPRYAPSSRNGFAVFSHRAVIDTAAFPEWVRPYTVLSIREPRSHAELGALYRQSRAMVTFERTSAIFEALSCGCPVICIGNDRDNFKEETWHPRFRDAGLIWGWREADLEAAAGKTARFRALYRELENNLDDRIQSAFDWILDDVWRRAHGVAP
ncbi:MAG: hypothetical protein GEU95_02180 [Rhizobiales bacterium]|nr:hypothetical protein [Hyphomicrobiales bacterium]